MSRPRSRRSGRADGTRRRSRGQSLVEFSLLLPVFLLILCGTMEYGFIFTHDLTLEYATREGARAGSALDNGGGTLGCGASQSPNWQTVDPLIIAAVERVLESPGSQVVISRVSQIVIYKANPVTGANDQGLQNVWTYAPGGGPVPQGATQPLNFVNASTGWRACARNNASPSIDSIGVSVTYTYRFQTPLAAILGFFAGGAPTATLTDRTVMVLNPSSS